MLHVTIKEHLQYSKNNHQFKVKLRSIQSLSGRIWKKMTNWHILTFLHFKCIWKASKMPLEKPRFPTVSKFMQTLMCLPHSSASSERKFSQLKLIKKPLRNRLSPSTVSSLMHAHRLVRSRGGAFKWKIPTTQAKAARQWKC